MKGFRLFCVLAVLISCVGKDPFSNLSGFWVSIEYQTGKSFQTLTISKADTTLFGRIPFAIEINQYGAYSYLEPLDTIHGGLEAYGPHWDTDFILKLDGDTLVQVFSLGETDERRTTYTRMDSLKVWRNAVFCDLQLQIDLPKANENDELVPGRRPIIADLFLGPLKEAVRDEYPEIAQDSTVLQVNDVVISSDEIEQYLRAEEAKLDLLDRDSIIVVLNADDKIPARQINGYVKRIKSFNSNLRVWRRTIDLDRRKFRYRRIISNEA